MSMDAATADAEREVIAAARRLLGATVDVDVATLETHLTPDYTYTHASSGVADSRDAWLESFRSGSRRYQAYDIRDLVVQVLDGVAILAGHAHQEMNPRGEPTELNTRFLSVWVRREGVWQCAAWQATRLRDA
jgi:ketosteroid isomerase-like protein